MAKNVGWIKLFRKLIDNRMYFDEPFDKTHAWIDLLLNADSEGQLRVTVKELERRWKWSANKVRRYLADLASDSMIQIDGTFVGTKGGTILTLVKYKDFQLRQQNDGTKDGINDGINQWGKGDLYNIYITRREEEKNISPNTLKSVTPKGVNEAPKKKQSKAFVIPTIEEVAEYCRQRNNGIDPEYFWHYYNSRDWKYKKGEPMASWKSAVITWEKNNRQNSKEQKKPVAKNEDDYDLSSIFGKG